jgi:hypothetical protein
MNLKKCFMVSLFLLAPVSHVNAIDLHEVVGQLAETTRHTKFFYKVADDFEAPKLSKRQDACFTALETELDGYEAQDYMLHSMNHLEEPLYHLYLTHWAPAIPAAAIEIESQQNKSFNEEIPKKFLQQRQQEASLREDSEKPLETDQKPNPSLTESQSIHQPEPEEQSNAQHEEPRPAEPEPNEESDDFDQPPVKVSKQRAEEKQRLQQEGPRKKGLFMLWTLTTPREEIDQEGPVDSVRAKAELNKAARLISLNMVIQKIRDGDTDHIYYSEDFTPEMQAIVKNMGVALLKPNTGFTTTNSDGESRTINDLPESLLF